MRKTLCSASRQPLFQPLAIAAAAALLFAPGLDAQAQSFTQAGANSTSGNPSGLPFVGSPTSLDFGNDHVFIGNALPGNFFASAGALLRAGALAIGTGGTGSGLVILSGTNTKIELGGNLNRLDVGNWGVGELTVADGALLDATVNPGNCSGSNCFNFIGGAAGSTGTMTISGIGSEVRTLRSFIVGQTSVFTNPPNTFTFGTPGGTTSARLNVLAGGTLRTEGAMVASNNASPNGNGNERANGTVVISGSGAQWIVTRNSTATTGNTAALMSIGSGANSDGLVTVGNGGKLHIDGTGSSGPNDGINIGSNGKGKLVVTGTGSQLLTSGVNPFINVGANNAFGNGTFELLAGATASTLYMNVGRNGGTGTMVLDGALATGTTLTQSGVGTNQAPGSNGAAFTNIGRNTNGNGGTGTVTVRGGAQWLINDGGGDGRTAQGSPGIAIGRGANSSGSLTITGTGSKVEISSTSLGLAPGVADNYNPFFAVGFDNAGTTSGALTVSVGGKLVMNGNAVSTLAIPRGTLLYIGGTFDTAGSGIATVTGAGSEIKLTGYDSIVNVGRFTGSTGTLNITDGALVSAITLLAGSNGGNGTVNVDNATVSLTGDRTDSNPAVGAGFNIGRTGVGTLIMSNGAQITATGTALGGAASIAGDSFGTGGSGTVTMSGGSSIVFSGPASSGLSIARTGTGTVSLSGGSFIDVGVGTIALANAPLAGQGAGGTGSLSLSGGSKASANQILIGGNSEGVGGALGGTGIATVTGSGSEIKASGSGGFLSVGRNGNGTLLLDDQAKASAIVLSVGRHGGSGILTANDATIELAGQQTGGLQTGAAFVIGTGGGIGSATLNNTVVTLTNAGSNGATFNVGGSGNFPGGTGVLGMVDSQVTLNAAAGLGAVNIGRNGTGVASLSGSTISNIGGNVYVGREVGSSGSLLMSSGSVLNAAYVGAGVSAPYAAGVQSNGGTGVIVLNDSTINTGVFELGAGGLLTGNNGTIDAVGDVIIGGTISPGNSPGRMRIRCNIIMLPGSRIVLEISGSGSNPADYEFDQLIIGDDASFDLASAEIVFSFLGDTNPNVVSALGGLNLDFYLRAGSEDPLAPIDGPTQALSTQFTQGQTWSSVVDPTRVSAVSESYDVTEFKITGEGTFALEAVPVPEPSTWGMLFFGLAAVGAVARRRKAQAAQA